MNQFQTMKSQTRFLAQRRLPAKLRYLKSPLFSPLAKGDDRGINAEELPEVVLSSPSIVGIRCSFRVEASREPALRSFQ